MKQVQVGRWSYMTDLPVKVGDVVELPTPEWRVEEFGDPETYTGTVSALHSEYNGPCKHIIRIVKDEVLFDAKVHVTHSVGTSNYSTISIPIELQPLHEDMLLCGYELAVEFLLDGSFKRGIRHSEGKKESQMLLQRKTGVSPTSNLGDVLKQKPWKIVDDNTEDE